jgi:hypothetical protein
MSDDDTELTPEELRAVTRGWLGLVKEQEFQGKGVYEQPEIRGQPPRGSFRLPKEVINKLGDGDPRAGGAVAHGMFGVEPDGDPTIIDADVVRDIGHGSLAAGRRVLKKFIAKVRRQSHEGVTLQHDGRQHDDGEHGWTVRR